MNMLFYRFKEVVVVNPHIQSNDSMNITSFTNL